MYLVKKYLVSLDMHNACQLLSLINQTLNLQFKLTPFFAIHLSKKNMFFGVTSSFNIEGYYMALSHKDWELPNSWTWLAKMDIDRGLDFPI